MFTARLEVRLPVEADRSTFVAFFTDDEFMVFSGGVLDEEAASNEQFKKILANWRQFRADQHRWFSIADTRAELAVFRTDKS